MWKRTPGKIAEWYGMIWCAPVTKNTKSLWQKICNEKDTPQALGMTISQLVIR